MNPINHASLARPTGFRFRSTEIVRREGLSDAVSAFAVTLLIVSLELPRTCGELISAMREFFAFATSFALLVNVSYDQHILFRHRRRKLEKRHLAASAT